MLHVLHETRVFGPKTVELDLAMQVLVSALGQALGAPAAENCIRPSQGQPKNEVAAVEATVHLSPAMQVAWPCRP